MIQSYRDLDVFQRSMRLLAPLHQQLLKFPDYERFELCAQIRRCSKSIPANIAEGYSKRRFEKEFRRHLNIAMGEANEMVVHVEICDTLGYIESASCKSLTEEYTIIGKQLYRLMSNWRTFPDTELV